jgi:Phospholipase_D-nuclease N-terminal/Short C-terminal domain
MRMEGDVPPHGESEGRMDWSFFDVVWSIFIFFFWVMFFWMFISVFSDIFRRDDLSGWGKAGWIFLIFVLPFLGILIYMIARPKMTEQDQRMLAEAQEKRRRLEGYSAADEISKLVSLRESGQISAEEFERLKAQAML